MSIDEHSDLGVFFLRLCVGVYFVWTGCLLLLDNTLRAVMGNLLSKTPLVMPAFASQAMMVVYTVYILVGALILIGLFTRAAGLLVAIISVIMMAVVNWNITAQYAGSLAMIWMLKDILLLGCGISLFFTGAKMWAVDCIMVE